MAKETCNKRMICGWTIKDFRQKAQEMLDDEVLVGLPSETYLSLAMDYMEENWDASIGANWDTVEESIKQTCDEFVAAEEEDEEYDDGDDDDDEDWIDDCSDDESDHREIYGSDDY